jgi:putative glutamine amidotransferase
MPPRILLPGKLTTGANGVRGDSYSNGLKYAEAVARAGGVVTAVAPLSEHLARVASLVAVAHGVLIQGGGDIDPARYGAARRSDRVYGIVDAHDDFEIAVVREAVRQDKPLLAICRGIQVLNVALGGTLHQDLGDVLADRESHWNTYHPITLDDGSRVAAAMGTQHPAHSHSYHHQALDEIAPGLQVTGRAPDGVVEAVEHAACYWVVGVQWHPEDDAADTADQQRLFDAFVAVCREAASTLSDAIRAGVDERNQRPQKL